MTTLTACRKALKQKSFTSGLLVIHCAGHADRRGIDRGYQIMAMKDAVDFVATHTCTLYDTNFRFFDGPWPLADIVAARIRTGQPVE
jgi:hypothetical protein